MCANTSSAARRPDLLDRVREAARVRHLSYRTEQAYVAWVKRFVLFHGKRHPRHMAKVEVEAFLTHLAVDGKATASTQNQALAAILFLYGRVLDQLRCQISFGATSVPRISSFWLWRHRLSLNARED